MSYQTRKITIHPLHPLQLKLCQMLRLPDSVLGHVMSLLVLDEPMIRMLKCTSKAMRRITTDEVRQKRRVALAVMLHHRIKNLAVINTVFDSQLPFFCHVSYAEQPGQPQRTYEFLSVSAFMFPNTDIHLWFSF